jgi:hypothetical protein
MKEKVAVVTVSGKTYYLIVHELKRRNIPFLSLTPYEQIPIGIKVVITTEEEKRLVKHEKMLCFKEGMEPELLASEALKIIRGEESPERIIIGVDPGEIFGLAVLADGKIIETENCFSVEQTLAKIESIIKNLANSPTVPVSVKIGDGVRECKERLLHILDRALPSSVMLESVSEAGTSSSINEAKHRRGLRDIVSAIQIAGRSGYRFQRRKKIESDG